MLRNATKGLLVGLFALTAVSGTSAYAQTSSSSGWIGGRMDTSLYIGANIGQSHFRQTCDDVPTLSCDDKDAAWKLFLGYQFHPNFAIEAGYVDFGKVTANGLIGGVAVSAEGNVSGWEFVGVVSYPIAEQFAIYGKLGVVRSRVSVTASGILGGFAATASEKERSTDLTFGLGVQYSFLRNVAARLEWQRYDSVGGDNIGKDHVDLISAGILYKF